MLKKLRSANRIELLVGTGFSLVGFLIGSTLIGHTFKSEIQLESPQEETQPDSKPYLAESFLDNQKPNSDVKSQETDAKPLQKEVPAISPSPVNEFTSLSQEEKNCVIWKNAYPEAAYKLKQGDACYWSMFSQPMRSLRNLCGRLFRDRAVHKTISSLAVLAFWAFHRPSTIHQPQNMWIPYHRLGIFHSPRHRLLNL